MKIVLITLLLIITFSWLPIPEITQAARAITLGLDSVPTLLAPNPKKIFISQATSGIGNGFSGEPSSSDRPNQQGVGANRGVCPSCSNNDNTKNKSPLTSLIPVRQQSTVKNKDNSTWINIPPTRTASENPTFWFYVPEPETSGKKAEFMLLYKNDAYAIKEPIPVPLSGMPGLLSFPLKKITLNDGLYHWFFTIVCDAKQPARNQNVEGWIEKITVSQELSSELFAASETRKIELYFKHKIWHEFVNLLAQGHRDRPNDKIILDREYTIEEAWQQILKEVGLNKDS